MSKINLTVSVDNNDKEDFNALVSKLGLNISAAINMFIKQSIRNQALPLDLSLDKQEKAYEDMVFEDAEKFVDKHIEAFRELGRWEKYQKI